MRTIIKTTEYNVIAKNAKPMTAVVVSDLHDHINEPVIDIIKQVDPDVILVPGDFIHSSSVYERGLDFLRTVSKIKPTFCSLGNHEHHFDGNIKSLVNDTGAVLLDNQSYVFNGLNIGGLSSGYKYGEKQKRLGKTPAPDLEWLDKYSKQDGYKILMSHHPEYYVTYIKNLQIDLVLSGHAHGGQIRLFGHGIIAPGQGFFPKYTNGIYDNRLIVSRGIGNQFIVPRFNNPPEIIVIKVNGEKAL